MPLTQPQNFFVTAVDNSFGGTGAGANNSGDRVTAIGARVAQRNALGADDVIAIGVDALPDNLFKTIIVIGNDSLPDNQATDQIVIGHGSGGAIGAGLVFGDNILIGHRVFPVGEDLARNVVIGNEIGELYTTATVSDFNDNVVIGHRAIAAYPPGSFGGLNFSVIIGAEAALNLDPSASGIGGNVIIGRLAGRGTANDGRPQNNVIIGEQAGLRIRNAIQNVLIGRLAGDDIETGIGNVFIGANCGGSIRDTGNNVIIGNSAGFAARFNTEESVCIGAESGGGSLNDRCVIIGNRAQAGVLATTLVDNIIIGANANSSASAGSQNLADALLFEIIGNGARRTIMYSQHEDGFANVMLGHNNVGTGVGTARDIVALGADGARNLVKLVDGAKAAATNPTAGGYFYVSAGALHWVGSGGTDTALAAA